MSVPWTQPTLGGPACKGFVLQCWFRWPLGWRGSLTCIMEGVTTPTELIKWSELTTEQLQEQLEKCNDLVGALVWGP